MRDVSYRQIASDDDPPAPTRRDSRPMHRIFLGLAVTNGSLLLASSSSG